MRLKLSRDYMAGRHRDASRLRDIGTAAEEQVAPDTSLLSLVKVSSRSLYPFLLFMLSSV